MIKPAINPIFQTGLSKMMDPSQMMGAFKVTGFDINSLMEMQHKNIEAMTSINQVLFDGLQSFARYQTELIRHSFEGATNLMQSTFSGSTPQEQIATQVEASQAVVEKYVANASNAAETLAKNNAKLMGTVSSRMLDNLKDLSNMPKPDAA